MADKSNKDKKASWQTRARRTKKHHCSQEQEGQQKASWQTRAIRTKKHHGRQKQSGQKIIMADKNKQYKKASWQTRARSTNHAI